MRSMLMFAALAAVIGFTGCSGAGGGKLGGCKLSNCLAGKAAGSALGARGASASVGDCGCASGGCASGGCGTCGPDSVVTTSAPYACDGGCGGAAPVSAASSCGCSSCGGGAVAPISVPSSCGCSSCDGGAVEYAPVQSAPVFESAPVQSSGCSACDSASTSKPRGFLQGERPKRKRGLASNKGLGLTLKGKGKACGAPRPLRSARNAGAVIDRGVSSGASCEACSAGVQQTVAQVPDGFLFGSASSGRRISSGIIADAREARGGCRGGGCLSGGPRSGGSHLHGGCGKRGCGAGGKHCADCAAKYARLADATGKIHPYGGVVPHTNPAAGQQPQSGIAPQYAYPYYTTRGPRDFLRDNPPSIGY